ncbi:ABC transporter substrate-binding protein [Spelaeicoccus albus]|nr:ABC transporter substrate-binding protein [Spelaeicoccus albus]
MQSRTSILASVLAVSLVGLAGCGSSEPPKNTAPNAHDVTAKCQKLEKKAQEKTGKGENTFVFAASTDPTSLNPFHTNDSDSFRIAHQIFEGLVWAKPCSPDPAPRLATKWNSSKDGKTYTFQLRKGVKFQDGTDFDSKAVCYNFEHMNNQPPGVARTEAASYEWKHIFKGFGSHSIYRSCETDGSHKVTIQLKSAFAGFLGALTSPAFAMQSPTALKKWDQVKAGEDPTSSEYATKHPTGTGPYKFVSWKKGKQVTLKRFDGYWGQKAKTPRVIITTIQDAQARANALAAGDIDGFDLVAPGDIGSLQKKGFDLIQRPPFNILYLGMNQKVKALSNIKVRKAIAYALNKEKIVKQTMTPGSTVAKEFIPKSVIGYNPDVTQYKYNPKKAKELLKKAGYPNLTLEFNYPTDVSRPYMPSPKDTFNEIRDELKAVGITIKPVADQWTDYLNRTSGTSDHGIHILGWTGEYNSADNFLGTFFGAQHAEWGFNNPQLFKKLAHAKQLPTTDEQETAYKKINEDIMKFLPGIPLGNGAPSLAFDPKVKGYVPSPVEDEVWNQVVVEK